jgi:HEAT repeat protein
MRRFTPQIDYCLQLVRSGDADTSFHSLLEIGPEVLPDLMDVFRTENDVDVREFLVRVIWEYRDDAAVPFLREALYDPQQRVWRQALDGLVTIASPASLEAMRAAMTREFLNHDAKEEFRGWLEEAIEQAQQK